MPNNNPSKLAKLRMPDYSGSWWQLHYEDVTSMRIGKYTPFHPIDVPGGSLLKLKPTIRFDSLPAVSPLYGGYTMRTKFYFVPYRLYIPELRRNRQLPWNSIPKLSLPLLQYVSPFGDLSLLNGSTLGSSAILAGSLLERLGMGWGEFVYGQSFGQKTLSSLASGYSSGSNARVSVNMLPLLAYIDSWMYGEYNPQDKNIPIDVDTLLVQPTDIGYSRNYERGFVSYDSLRARMDSIVFGTGSINESSCAVWSPASEVDSDGQTSRHLEFNRTRPNFVAGYPLFTNIRRNGSVVVNFTTYGNFFRAMRNMCSAAGLLPVTYKGDRYSSWYSEEGISILKDYKVTAGQTFLSLRKSNSDFMLSALSLISGNRWVDYLQFVFDTDLELKDHPIMVGYDEQHFGMIDILSQSQTGNGLNGQLGSRASMAREYNNNIKPISFKTKEPGLILVCSSIVPTVSYYQGYDRFMWAQHIEDLWQPPYSSQGFMQTFRGEYLCPWVMPDTLVIPDGLYQRPSGVNLKDLNKVGVSWVPLGWQYMSSYKRISGALKTDAYKTWTNRRSSETFDDVLLSSSPVSNFNVFEDTAVDLLSSTYVDSFQFNDNFVNVSNAERENFVVALDMPYSIYQPVSKTLINKTI